MNNLHRRPSTPLSSPYLPFYIFSTLSSCLCPPFFVFICVLVTKFLPISVLLNPSLVSSRSNRNRAGEHKNQSSSTEAKPEMTAPILDRFPPVLPPVAECDTTMQSINGLFFFFFFFLTIARWDFSMTAS